MGWFNTLIHEVTCRGCGSIYPSRSQFKYGDLWNHEYRIGERIRLKDDSEANWEVVAELWCDGCPNCGNKEVRQIHLRNGTIAGEVPHEEYIDLGTEEWVRIEE